MIKVVICLALCGVVSAQTGPGGAGGVSQYPVGTGSVTSIATGNCLTGGPVTTSGTISLGTTINPQTSTYQVLAADFSLCKTITVASGTFTITLVATGTQPANGTYINIVNYGSGVVTVARSGQNINGGTASLTLNAASATAPTGATVWSDGTNYLATIGGAVPATVVQTNQSNTYSTGTQDFTAATAVKPISGTGALQVTSGTLGLVSGASSNCVLVNGTSAACDAPGQGAVTNKTPVTATNPSSVTALQQLNITAGLLNIDGNSGGSFNYQAAGTYTVASLQTPTLTWALHACTNSACSGGTDRSLFTIITPAVVTAINNVWVLRAKIANTTTGASGTLFAHGTATVELTAASDLGTSSNDSNTASTAAIDLTGLVYLQLYVTASSSNAGNTVTNDQSSLEPASAIGPTGPTGPAGGVGYTIVSFSSTPTFTVAASKDIQNFEITLTGNVTSSTLATGSASVGQDIAFKICQDGTGGRTFVWPTNVVNPGNINSTLSVCSKQIFRWDGSNAVAFGPMVADGATPGITTATGFLTLPTGTATLATTANSGQMVLISDQTVGSAVATITFSSIPATYKHLQLVVNGRCSGALTADDVYMQNNGDGGANYSRQYTLSNNVTVSGNHTISSAKAGVAVFPCATDLAGEAGSGQILIYDYAGTAFKKNATAQADWYDDSSPIGVTSLWHLNEIFHWESAAAINQIVLGVVGGSNFTTGSRFTLYGLN